MGLNQLSPVEKCAGRFFRDQAEMNMAAALLDFPDSAPCSAQVAFYRHPCKMVKGRTRAIQLKDMMLISPEIWVCWHDDTESYEALSAVEAQVRLNAGVVAEYETVLAGKFTYAWKQGKCGHCDLIAISREGVFKDARPAAKLPQNDLQVQPAWPKDLAALKREVGLA